VTRGAAQVDQDTPPTPEQALVAGLGRVAALEHPDAWGGMVDVAAGEAPASESLIAAVGGVGVAQEPELALRAGRLFARRLVREAWSTEALAPARYDGTALITGGTGALGRQVARFLAERGVEHVVLTSRSGDSSPGIEVLRREVEGLGARISVLALDVADREQLAAVLEGLRAQGEQLQTVVHAAGVNAFVPTAELDAAQLSQILRAKVLGARNLDALLRAEPPTRFVLFASGAGIWGSAGQSAYAGANAYLDALALRRAAQGLPATSIAWGIWDGDGMASGSLEAMRLRGVLPLQPALALHALERALAEQARQLTLADFDWETFLAVYGAAREQPLLSELVVPSAAPAMSEPSDGARTSGGLELLIAQLRAASPSQRERRLLQLVCDAMAEVLGVDARGVQPDTALKDLGMDSLMAVQLRNRLAALTGKRLAATLLFSYPTPTALAQYLWLQLAPEVTESMEPSSVLREIDRLEELGAAGIPPGEAALLAHRLQALMVKWRLPLAIDVAQLQPAAADDEHIFDGADDEQLMRLVDESIGQQGI
jgi:NAD(P)-dependent dehydrogenase (short-subunit alcohol dehydrogenase family)/acyl carrier protein